MRLVVMRNYFFSRNGLWPSDKREVKVSPPTIALGQFVHSQHEQGKDESIGTFERAPIFIKIKLTLWRPHLSVLQWIPTGAYLGFC